MIYAPNPWRILTSDNGKTRSVSAHDICVAKSSDVNAWREKDGLTLVRLMASCARKGHDKNVVRCFDSIATILNQPRYGAKLLSLS